MRRDCVVRLGLAVVHPSLEAVSDDLGGIWYAVSLVQRPF